MSTRMWKGAKHERRASCQPQTDRMTLRVRFSFLNRLISGDYLHPASAWRWRERERERRKGRKEGGGWRTERDKRIQGRHTGLLKGKTSPVLYADPLSTGSFYMCLFSGSLWRQREKREHSGEHRGQSAAGGSEDNHEAGDRFVSEVYGKTFSHAVQCGQWILWAKSCKHILKEMLGVVLECLDRRGR